MSSFTSWAGATIMQARAARNSQSGRAMIEEQVIGVLTKDFNIAGFGVIQPDHKLGKDLKLDSLDGVEFAMKLEDKFGIAIIDYSRKNEPEENPAVHLDMSVSQVVDLVLTHLECN